MISPEKTPTFAAVALATGILALMLGALALIEARTAGVAAAGMMHGFTGYQEKMETRVADLEAQLAELEKTPAPEPVVEPATEEPAEAPAE